jgi:hypothetical protein
MADFSFRSDSVDVEQIMRQIRARIREKRGVDYTEQQLHELATAKLERFLDPKGVRSDLLERYRQHRVAATVQPPSYAFEDTTLFESDKPIVRFFRRLLRPILKLFFNYNTLSHVLHTQAAINHHWLHVQNTRDEHELLSYEVMHNLVLETTRLGIDVKNMKMRVESIASRLEFNERRARALEAVVQYKPEAREAFRAASADTEPVGGVDPITGGESLRTRRRRRRRGRRAGQGGPVGGQTGSAVGPQGPDSVATRADAEVSTPETPAGHVGLGAPETHEPPSPGSENESESSMRESSPGDLPTDSTDQ